MDEIRILQEQLERRGKQVAALAARLEVVESLTDAQSTVANHKAFQERIEG
jgi:hypothetical protein